LQPCNGIAANRRTLDVESEVLLCEMASGVVVLQGHFRAGNAVVLGLDMQP
jgi:hypothetical protein